MDTVTFEASGAENLMAKGSLSPRHYVVLESLSGTSQQRKVLSDSLLVGLMKWPHWAVADLNLKAGQVLVEIPGQRIQALVKGADVRLTNYRVSGDEWLAVGEFEELFVAGKLVNTKKAEQAVPPKSDRAGG